MLRFKKQKIIEREREDGTAKSIKIPKSQIPLLRASQRHAARTSHNPRPSTPQSHSQTSTRRRRCRFRLCAPALQLLAVPRVALSSVQAHFCQFRSSCCCCCRWLASSFVRWSQPHKFVPHQRKDLLLYNMDPRCTGEMFKHLEKQNELLTEIHRSMSHELHKLQVEEEMLMRKFYELMTAHGLTKKNEGSANASDDGEAGNSASLLCLPSNDQQ